MGKTTPSAPTASDLQIDLASLTSVHTFAGLNDSQLKQVAAALQVIVIDQGDYIIYENTQGSALYILYRGRVNVTRKLTLEIEGLEAEEKMLASLSDKNLPAFGENGLVCAGKRSANVIAKTDCVMYKLEREAFERLVEHDTAIGYHMMRNISQSMARRLETTDEYVVKLATALSIAVQMKR
ncbi:MAG: cyclic nucleotide-binding domain-containing protein [Candidatus Cloacimonetes bacterium]|nr:cyclic nucleotide-binding domain-containing protein [Candidatus Cloacimonadota bacterium]